MPNLAGTAREISGGLGGGTFKVDEADICP